MIIRPCVFVADILVCVAALGAGGARADAPASDGIAACAGPAMTSGEVARVIDGKSFLLADGREVRLAAIETPEIAAVDHGDGRTGAARAALETLVLHRHVAMRSSSFDRYGRVVAQVFTIGQPGETPASNSSTDISAAASTHTSIQRVLLAAGYALLSPTSDAACRNFLRAAERQARSAELGVWGDPYYLPKRAENPADVLATRGQFGVVEGKVVSVRESGGTIYVNFGRRWSEDFTVTILKRNERMFVGAGVEPRKLAGRRIEVRGWIEERGGPAIEAIRPEQIEIVEGN